MEINSSDLESSCDEFWNELQEIASGHYQSISKVEHALSRYINLAALYFDKYLDQDEDLTRCGYHLIHSSIFNNNKAYVRRKLISLLLESNLDLSNRIFIGAILLIDGRRNPATLEMMQEESATGTLINTIWKSQMKSPRLHRIFLELFYEMCRIQKLTYSDLSLVKSEFLNYLFTAIENKDDYDYDPYGFAVIKVLLALNEQFMVAAYSKATQNNSQYYYNKPHSSSEAHIENLANTDEEHTEPSSEIDNSVDNQFRKIKSEVSLQDLEHHSHQHPNPDYSAVTLENKVFNTLCLHKDQYRTFGENIVFLLNRSPDNTLQLMVLKFLYLIFTTPATYEYLYLNDLKVIVDVFIRELYNLSSDEENLIHTYLRVLHPLLLHTELRRERYKAKELVSLLEGMSENASRYCIDISETTQRLAYRCLFVDWIGAPSPTLPRKCRTFDETISTLSKSRSYSDYESDSTPSVATISEPVSPHTELADSTVKETQTDVTTQESQEPLPYKETSNKERKPSITPLHITHSAPAYLEKHEENDEKFEQFIQNPQQTGESSESSRSSYSNRSYDRNQDIDEGMTPTSPVSTLSSGISSLSCESTEDSSLIIPYTITPPPQITLENNKNIVRGVLPPPPPPSRSNPLAPKHYSLSLHRSRPPPPPPPSLSDSLTSLSEEQPNLHASSIEFHTPPPPPPPQPANRLKHAKSSDALRMLGTLGFKRCAPPPPPVPPLPFEHKINHSKSIEALKSFNSQSQTSVMPPRPPPPRTLRKPNSTNTLGMSIRNTSAIELAYARDNNKDTPPLPSILYEERNTRDDLMKQNSHTSMESLNHYDSYDDETNKSDQESFSHHAGMKQPPQPPNHHHPHHLQKKVSMPSFHPHSSHHHQRARPLPPPPRHHSYAPCPPASRMYMQHNNTHTKLVASHPNRGPPPPPPQRHNSEATIIHSSN
ncbi:uncharacterized protein SAPINGB_P003155 [Magnusiomyces paraingens]|uniref:SPIN90/Ldb17 leucine-rich domain-containing protein n=1 Tax=Magnusiomyces paraingens TaxID=2606893 RepID=A0A5E8BQ22_9ASCO|nr:uncharacterized protein SAPINGB_P003155 [Saprochaete ingens]VVT51615.1 unnamed protein product [Saprochaete ingens]